MAVRRNALLVVQSGTDSPGAIPLDGLSNVLGRLPQADIGLENPFVSRRHAEIGYAESGYYIRDLDSSNGTFVDGVKIDAARRPLRGGELIEFGEGQVISKFTLGQGTITLPQSSGRASGSGTPEAPQTISPHGVVINPVSREVYVQGVPVVPPLSGKDFDILEFLCESPGTARSKEEIADKGWPERPPGTVSDQEIGQRIHRIRSRIEPDPGNPRYIELVRGFGYRLNQS